MQSSSFIKSLLKTSLFVRLESYMPSPPPSTLSAKTKTAVGQIVPTTYSPSVGHIWGLVGMEREQVGGGET